MTDYAKRLADIEHEIDLMHNDEPVCPHCGYKMTDAWELEIEYDGDTITVECAECEKDYKITLGVEYSYSTSKTKDGE